MWHHRWNKRQSGKCTCVCRPRLPVISQCSQVMRKQPGTSATQDSIWDNPSYTLQLLQRNVVTESTVIAAACRQNQDNNPLREGEIHLVVVKGESMLLTYLKTISSLQASIGSRKGQNWATILALRTEAPAMALPSIVTGELSALAAPHNLLP